MPVYEYKCDDCESTFTVIATMTEKAKGLAVTCRMCGSAHVRQVFSGISFMGGSNSGQPSGGGCNPGCGCCQ